MAFFWVDAPDTARTDRLTGRPDPAATSVSTSPLRGADAECTAAGGGNGAGSGVVPLASAKVAAVSAPESGATLTNAPDEAAEESAYCKVARYV